MKKTVKIIIALILAALLAAGAVWSEMKPMAVPAITASEKEAYAYFTETGTVTGSADFSLLPQVSGKVLRVLKQKGDYTEEGEIIIEVDSSEYARQIKAGEVSIAGYKAQAESVRMEESNTKDEFRAQIASLNTERSQVEAAQKSAEASRLSAQTVSERLELLEVTIERLKSDVKLSRENLDKLKLLYDAGAVSKAELDEAEAAYESSLSQLQEYETQYAQTNSKESAGALAEIGEEEQFASQQEAIDTQIAALNKNLNKDYSQASIMYYQSLIDAENLKLDALREKVENCAVKTPVAGYVSDIPAEGLSQVSEQSPVAIIKTEGETKLEAYVSTKDIAYVKENDAVEIIIKGRDEDSFIQGKVHEVSKWAETKASALGLDEKKVRVVIEASVNEALIPGSDADIRFTIYREQDKILVPTGAVFTYEGADCVFVIENGKAVIRQIAAGPKTLTETVVESGINAGDTVIIEANQEGLTEGARVEAVIE